MITRNIIMHTTELSYLTKELKEAIGYLTTWSITSTRIATVKISWITPQEISATYFNVDNQIVYQLVAIRNADNSYSFNS